MCIVEAIYIDEGAIKSVWERLKKIKIEYLYNPEIPVLGIYLKIDQQD